MVNQDLRDPTNNTWHERDIIAINLSRGCILNIEVKSTISRKHSQGKTGQEQLRKSLEIFEDTFDNQVSLQQEWKVVNVLYGTKINPNFKICPRAMNFVITENDNFVQKLSQIMNQNAPKVNAYSYVADFYQMVSEILPERMRICKELVETFQNPVNEVLLENITKNVEEEAGAVEMISYWSDDQKNLISECRNLKRVLFDSAFSTGKTLMLSLIHI